ncbi:hypothetical protein RR42_m3923 [Cupriavidus basilensis]|uniref:Uncharacterized protein n=1 Tax=Cupriavidus basilensis TaxID=68895 RepID=A0A0C4Y799_9BURK|nr:hypothetical protein RR42_m3923 [Cupriavidus basilensis]
MVAKNILENRQGARHSNSLKKGGTAKGVTIPPRARLTTSACDECSRISFVWRRMEHGSVPLRQSISTTNKNDRRERPK